MGESGLKSGYVGDETEEVPIGFTVSVSPKPTSLVTFLFGDKKVTPLARLPHSRFLTRHRREEMSVSVF